ncbi:MAG: hypothetical protein WAX69_02565 [Victivallales bacterium]
MVKFMIENTVLREVGGDMTIEEAFAVWPNKAIVANIPAYFCRPSRDKKEISGRFFRTAPDPELHVRTALELAGSALLAMLDPEKDHMPTDGYEEAHDLGRWWDAALRLEEMIGFVIPAELEAASLRNLQRLTDNPDRLLMNRLDVPWLSGKAKINPHNFRETLLAFGGLVRRRQSAWAREAGLQLVRAMDRCLRTDGSFDYTQLGCWGQAPYSDDPSHTQTKRNGWFDSTGSSGRSLEALVWFFEATGEPLVLDVARRIAEHHLRFSTNKDGSVRAEIVNPENVGHNHSYHGTLRGLLRFGLLTGQKEYVDVVEATYRHADHRRIVMESGWAPHDLGKPRFSNNHGDPGNEPSTTGDAAQLALWLALEAGCLDLLDDVERYVRARILPAQLTENDVRCNQERKFSRRECGSWGAYGPSHAGKGCIPDILAAVIHSLCDIYGHICTQTPVGIRVNLHFDYEDARLKITSLRNDCGLLSVLVKQPDNIMVRIPQWTPEASLKLSLDGQALPVQRLGSFAWISCGILSAQSKIELSYELPKKQTEELMPSGRRYRFWWRGDEIIGVSPQDEPLPFYPDAIAAQGDK